MFKDFVMGNGLFASGIINHLPGAIVPVGLDRTLDTTMTRLRNTPYQGLITLVHLTFLKLAGNVAHGLSLNRYDEDARGVKIQSVHDNRIGKISLQAMDDTILVFRGAARHRQQEFRFI